LCITIAANIAKTGVLTFPACFPDSVVGFSADPALTSYVQTWLGFLQPVLERSAPQVAQRNINLEILRALPVPVPPTQKVKAFAGAVTAVRTVRAQMAAELDSLAVLGSGLAGRAFAGEL
jgi:type I restriction enzyme S subunit